MKVIKYLAVIAAAALIVAACYKIYQDRTAAYIPSGTDGYVTSTGNSSTSEEPDSKWEELLTYAEYLEMTAAERSAFADSFEDSSEFFEWLNAVMDIYEQQQKDNEIGQDGVIDMDKINPNG